MLQWIAYVVIVSLVLGFAALSAERALRLRRAATRWVWLVAIVASLVLPTIIASVSVEVPNITASRAPAETITLRNVTSLSLAPLSYFPLPTEQSPAGIRLASQLKTYWLMASGALLILLVASGAQVFWRKRRWRRATVAGVPVFVASGVGPAVVGLLRPCIVIPPWVLESSPSRQAHVVAHEQSHLVARDSLLLTTGLGLLVFMPWNVPLWWQLRRLRRAIEVDCDARVLSAGHDVTRYGETLIEVGQRQSTYLGAVAAMSESQSFLEQRLRIMLSKPGSWWKLSATLLGCASVCLVAVAAQVTPPNTAAGADTQAVAAVDPAVYDGLVGYYQFGESAVMTISRDGNRLLTRLTGQGPVEIFPSSNTEYFAKQVKARITFETDAQGRASSLTLHQNGRELQAPRMDAQLAKQIEETLQARVQSQTPQPGSEDAVRRLYASVLAGKPIYDDMAPALAQATREQFDGLNARFKNLGPIQSVTFRGVGNQGWDVYDLRHEHGVSTMRVTLSSDGKIQGALFQAGP